MRTEKNFKSGEKLRNMMSKAEFGKAIIEYTGSQWVVRVWHDAPRRLEWAYGDTEVEAWENLRARPTVVPLEDLEEVVLENLNDE